MSCNTPYGNYDVSKECFEYTKVCTYVTWLQLNFIQVQLKVYVISGVNAFSSIAKYDST